MLKFIRGKQIWVCHLVWWHPMKRFPLCQATNPAACYHNNKSTDHIHSSGTFATSLESSQPALNTLAFKKVMKPVPINQNNAAPVVLRFFPAQTIANLNTHTHRVHIFTCNKVFKKLNGSPSKNGITNEQKAKNKALRFIEDKNEQT